MCLDFHWAYTTVISEIQKTILGSSISYYDNTIYYIKQTKEGRGFLLTHTLEEESIMVGKMPWWVYVVTEEDTVVGIRGVWSPAVRGRRVMMLMLSLFLLFIHFGTTIPRMLLATFRGLSY